MVDTYQNGQRKSGTGEAYVKLDPLTLNTAAASTVGMVAVGLTQQINPYGTARVSIEPGTTFHDSFDGATIDASRWTAAGTLAPTQAAGVAAFSLGTGNSISRSLISNLTFPTTFGFQLYGATITLEAAQLTNPNSHRWFGPGQVTSWAAATPITDGAGFEVDVTGAFNAVVWIAGVRYVVNSTNTALITAQASLPTGAVTSTYGQTMVWPGNSHRVVIAFRGDLIYFYLDSLDVPVGVASFLQPAVSGLPLRIANITTAAVSTVLATTFSVGAVGVGDTSAQNHILQPSAAPAAAPVNATTAAYAASQILKAGPGTLYALNGYNSLGSAQFIQVHDSATLPADNAVPAMILSAAASGNFNFPLSIYGRKFANGIVVCNSTTGPMKTIGAANCWFDGQVM